MCIRYLLRLRSASISNDVYNFSEEEFISAIDETCEIFAYVYRERLEFFRRVNLEFCCLNVFFIENLEQNSDWSTQQICIIL